MSIAQRGAIYNKYITRFSKNHARSGMGELARRLRGKTSNGAERLETGAALNANGRDARTGTGGLREFPAALAGENLEWSGAP